MLENIKPPVKIQPCKVRQVFASLDDADQKIFAKALKDVEAWSAYALAAAMTQAGVKIGDETIRKHRDGMCSC